MINRFEKCAGHERRAIGRRVNCRHHQGVCGTVTVQALAKTPLESRPLGLHGIHCVEDETLSRIERDYFEYTSVFNRSYSDAVIEVNRARRFRPNFRQLKTCFRKHQNLRIDIDVEMIQQIGKISPSIRVVAQLRFSIFDLFCEKTDGILQFRYMRSLTEQKSAGTGSNNEK